MIEIHDIDGYSRFGLNFIGAQGDYLVFDVSEKNKEAVESMFNGTMALKHGEFFNSKGEPVVTFSVHKSLMTMVGSYLIGTQGYPYVFITEKTLVACKSKGEIRFVTAKYDDIKERLDFSRG